MNFIEKTLRSDNTNKILLFILLFFFARSVGGRLMIVAEGFTLGSLMRTFLPALLYLFLIMLIFVTNFSNLSLTTLRLESPNIKLKQIFLILCLALPLSLLVFYAGGNIAMTNNLIILFIIAAFLISLFVSIKYDVFYGGITFILTFPFLAFIQRELGGIFFKDGFNLGPIVLTPAIIFLLVLSLVYLLLRFTRGKSPVEIPLYRTIGIYLIVFFISVVTSGNFERSLKKYLLEIIYPVLFFFIIANRVRTDKGLRFIVSALITSAVLFGFFDYYFIMRGSMVGVSELSIVHGIYFLGGERELFLLLTLPLALSLAVTSSKGKGLILLLAGLIMIAFLLFSHTRVATIAMFASLFVFVRNKRVMIIILSLSILAAVFWDWTFDNIFIRFQEFTSLESLHPLSWSPMRYHAWMAAIEMIKDYPLGGIGWGMWESHYPNYGPPFIYDIPGYGLTKVWVASAHNAFLDVASQTGIPGLIAWLLLMGTISKEALYIFRRSVDRTRKTLALGCISSLVAFWVICLIGGYPSFSADKRLGAGIAFWSVVSILFAIKRLELSKESKAN